MDTNFVAILQKLLTEQGRDVIFNVSKCKALLADYTCGEYKKEIKLLLLALNEKVAEAIDKTDDLKTCKLIHIRLLKDELGWTEGVAVYIVDTLALVLRGDTTKSFIANHQNLTAKEEVYKEHRDENKDKTVKIDTQGSSYYSGIRIQNAPSGIIIKPKEKSIITFGGYKWLVLETQNDRALIITKDIVEKREYHGSDTGITWANCSLGAYLNGRFYNLFSDSDKARIIPITNINEKNQWYGMVDGGVNTTDKIFLLSIAEVVKYFGDSGQLRNGYAGELCIDDQFNSKRIAKYEGASSFWWLRSPGFVPQFAAYVHSDGSIYMTGRYVLGTFSTCGVRPALWLHL